MPLGRRDFQHHDAPAFAHFLHPVAFLRRNPHARLVGTVADLRRRRRLGQRLEFRRWLLGQGAGSRHRQSQKQGTTHAAILLHWIIAEHRP